MTGSELLNKSILITGATDGIGKVTAIALANQGAEITITGRSVEKAKRVVDEICQLTGNTKVGMLVADLSDLAQVEQMANRYLSNHDRLDVLVNNVGAVFMSRQENKDGIEMTLALNHLSPFLLTHRLLGLLKESSSARIVNVSSIAHRGMRIDLNDLEMKNQYNSWIAYGRSKLMNIYFTYELAKRLNETQITANVLHPGFVATNFGKSNGGIFKPLFRFFQIAAISPEKGSETSIYLASSSKVEGVTGKYFENKKAVRSSSISYDQEIGRKLWQQSLLLTGLVEKEEHAFA